MGDAGPVSAPAPHLDGQTVAFQESRREVTVLVTGFGPFKSFAINPSFLIASRLPPYLYPGATSSLVDRQNDPPQPVIKVVVHPLPIRVSYNVVAESLASIIASSGCNPDFVLHIGMAGGRDHYALETLARRDDYVIKDVDDGNGKEFGETRWKEMGLPDVLGVGWDALDVLQRWRQGLALPLKIWRASGGGDDIVRLSTDAGRFLCEFILYESLSMRAVEDVETHAGKKGKVAFLHVPGPVDAVSIARGVSVAEMAIRAIVGSWDDGRRAEGFAV